MEDDASVQADDLGYYDYLPITDRPLLTWPNGARLAVWFAPNVEFYELMPPSNPARAAWPLPMPDVSGYAARDYGNRVGFWRLIEVMDRFGLRASAALNVAVCDHHPEVIAAMRERNWEFFSHGIYNSRYTHGMTEAQERALIEDAFESVERHTGARLRGWLSPALTNTKRTPDLLAEYGIAYSCDFMHDDQPLPLKVAKGRLISIPYSVEINDGAAYQRRLFSPQHFAEAIKAQFDQLYAEGGRVMCIVLHPYLSGHPYRLKPFAGALEYITGHPDVWFTTGAEIADWYYTHHYDTMVQHLAARGSTPSRRSR
jgi:peptidoglycan/xylan/chitin deacetylase (PgdA/CDA1 family)